MRQRSARPDSGLGNSWNILNGPASEIVWNKNQIDFDGSGISASTADDSSTTLEVDGVTNSSELLYHTLRITGGTNFVPGTYTILGVNGDDLTLDRDPSSGGAGGGLTGTLQATLIRDEGFGNVYDGLALYGSSSYPYDGQTFNTGNPADHCAVLMHFLSKTDATPNGAKANVENVTVADADVGFLCSIGLDENHDVYDVQPTASNNYKSADYNNSDHVSFSKILAQSIDTLFQVRTTQGLSYMFWDVHTSKVNTLFYIERGGKMKANGIWTTSNGANGPTLLRIGGGSSGTPTQSATVSSPISIDGFTFDAPSQNLKLLEADSTGNAHYEVELANGTINEPFKRIAAMTAVGTAYSGTASTIRLAAATDRPDSFFAGNTIRLTGGTGAGQIRNISTYTGDSDTVTVDANWTVTPNSSTRYEITNAGTAQGGNTASTIKLDVDTNKPDGYYGGCTIRLTGNTGAGQVRRISAYSSTSDTASVSANWMVTPDSTTTYEITNESIAHDGAASTIVLDNNTDQPSSEFVGKFIRIIGGKGLGQIRGIMGYDQATDTLTVNVPWQVIPDSTSEYEIFGGEKGSYYDVETPVVTATDGAFVTLRNITPLLPNWVRLENTDTNFKPMVLITGCVLQGPEDDKASIIAEPQQVLDLLTTAGHSQSGTEVCFIGNTGGGFDGSGSQPSGDFNLHQFCRSGVYRIGTGWITSGTGFSWMPVQNAHEKFYAALGIRPEFVKAAGDEPATAKLVAELKADHSKVLALTVQYRKPTTPFAIAR